MSLKDWEENCWLRRHASSREEVAGLLSVVDRDLRDAAKTTISADWRFGIAYNAALKLCTILVHASGYRPEKSLLHFRTIQALPLILGEGRKKDAAYLDQCRIKRNEVEYDHAGGATAGDADELLKFGKELRKDVLGWLSRHHPDLVPMP